jgi:crossover junction endodeoxyribonuclease RusA
MVGMIRFILGMPPSINHYYARAGNRTYLPAKVKEYRQEVADIVAAAGHETLTGRLAVFIAVHPASKRRQDLDNRCKGILDALTHAGVWDDDEQIDHLELVRQPIIKGGRMVVLITEKEM